MTSGGKRIGAGRKKGSPNKATAAKAAEIAASGVVPLDYMLQVMRDPDSPQQRRDEMAKAAAPYVHPRLAAQFVAPQSDKPSEWMAKIMKDIQDNSKGVAGLIRQKPIQPL